MELYNPVYLHLEKAIKRPKSEYNLVLKDRDSIFIPITNDVVTITGALDHLSNNAISAPYFDGRSTRELLCKQFCRWIHKA